MANMLVGSELRKGSGFVRKGQGFQLIFGETWHYRVKTDGVTSDRYDVLYNTPGLPRAGLLYGALNLVCDELSCERDEKHREYWNVTARFQTGTEEQKQDSEQNPDPTTWIPIFKIDSFTVKQRVVAKDKTTPTAKAAVNSAGTPFDDPLTESRSLCQFSFVQFEDPSLKIKDFLDRNDCVNDATFNALGQSFGARTLLLEIQEAELGTFAGYSAWRVKYRVTYDPDTHDETRLDVGPYYKSGGNLLRYMDANNVFGIVGSLDGSGGKAATPFELTFQLKKKINFASFIRT